MHVEIKLCEALKLQKILTDIMKDIRQRIKGIDDTGDNLSELHRMSKDLVSLKVAIRKANVFNGIARKIYELYEERGLYSVYNQLGKDTESLEIKSNIDELSEEIKELNNSTTIQVKINSRTLANIVKKQQIQ